jgi:hypothetical protein
VRIGITEVFVDDQDKAGTFHTGHAYAGLETQPLVALVGRWESDVVADSFVWPYT